MVANANPRTIVIIAACGGGVGWAGWLDKVPVVLHAWYPGTEGGRAIAELVFGDVNPSGKLPATFEKRFEDNPAYEYFMKKEAYGEGIFVGYRGYDKNGVDPQFPFGYGLSYTSFEYSNLQLESPEIKSGEKLSLSFDVKNTGLREGSEVSQVYVGSVQSKVPRPPKELKGFCRTTLKPAESRKVSIELDGSSFAYFDPESRRWTIDPGPYVIMAGASSRNLPLRATVTLK